MGKVTARDVAKAAGVSPATVSLVFRGKPGVGRETRDRVIACAKNLGYEYLARDPERPSTTLLLVVFKRTGQVVGETPFFDELIGGVSDATYRMGFHRLTVTYFYATQDAHEQMDALRQARCAGIILLATEAKTVDIAQFERLGVPIVLLDSWFPGKKLDSVVIDNMLGGYDAVRHLVARGHRDIGYLHCGVPIRNFIERQSGFVQAMREVLPGGMEKAPDIVRVGSTVEEAYQDMKAYLTTNPRLCSAYFADNDIVAAGCMRALEEHGASMPDEVSIIGFDDTTHCLNVSPTLSTMAVPKRAMGELAVKRLTSLIRGETNGEGARISVFPTVVERESVAWMRPEAKP